ncbi:MAG: AraC family ligand binding domain-containing protein [bacterium]
MPVPEERLRPHPTERFAGAEHLLDLDAALRALRAEAWPSVSGHRQIALMHHGPVRLVLFAFHPGGCIKEHSAPGWVTIHALHGTLQVRTQDAVHRLTDGMLLSLAPGAPHDVEAMDEADMLLGVYPEAPR